MCLLYTKFQNPPGLTMDPARLFVMGEKACPPGPFDVPSPSKVTGNAEYVRTRSVLGGVETTAAFRGRECRVQVAGWYDANGSGKLDAGDWLGASQALDVRDEGLFGDNSARSADATMIQRS
jgi:hypothetical protein